MTKHQSPVTSHQSPVTSHQSPVTSHQLDDIVSKLRDYFLGREEIDMALLFGSWVKGRACIESDVDVAVYFVSEANGCWTEYDREFPTENDVWGDIEKLIGREIDMLVLNRAFPTVADAALKGIPLVVKRRNVFVNLLIRVTSEAIDLREWVASFWKMKQGRKYGHIA